MLHNYYPTEDDYFDALADAHETAEREAMRSAESAAELWDFESDEERVAYIEEEFAAEYERLCQEYEKAL